MKATPAPRMQVVKGRVAKWAKWEHAWGVQKAEEGWRGSGTKLVT